MNVIHDKCPMSEVMGTKKGGTKDRLAAKVVDAKAMVETARFLGEMCE